MIFLSCQLLLKRLSFLKSVVYIINSYMVFSLASNARRMCMIKTYNSTIQRL